MIGALLAAEEAGELTGWPLAIVLVAGIIAGAYMFGKFFGD